MEGPPERERGAHLHLSMRRITNCRLWFVMVQTVCRLGGEYSSVSVFFRLKNTPITCYIVVAHKGGDGEYFD